MNYYVLSYERYIDDQLEIDEVWNICKALIKRGRFEEEDWLLRKRILHEMVTHAYYNCYGCYDPIKELAEELYITDEETEKGGYCTDQYGIKSERLERLTRTMVEDGVVPLFVFAKLMPRQPAITRRTLKGSFRMGADSRTR